MPGIQDLPRLALLPLAVATRTAGLAWSVARSLGARLRPEPAPSRAERPSPPPGDRAQGRSTSAPAAAAPAPAPAAPEPPAPKPAAPAHVDTEVELVGEFADPGAADGAGANVRIAEPWDNYSKLTADQVIDRLAAADAESIAAVRLYEAANRNRTTVIAAADQRLATAAR